MSRPIENPLDYRRITLNVHRNVVFDLGVLKDFRKLFGYGFNYHDQRVLSRWIAEYALPAFVKSERRRQRRWARRIEAEVRDRDHAAALAEYKARERGETPPEIPVRTQADVYSELAQANNLDQKHKPKAVRDASH